MDTFDNISFQASSPETRNATEASFDHRSNQKEHPHPRLGVQQREDVIHTDDGDYLLNLPSTCTAMKNCGQECDDEGSTSCADSSSTSSRGDSSVGSDDWPIEASHLCYELETNNLPCQNRHGDVLELRSNFIRERDVPRILKALEQNTSVATADLCEFSFSKLQPASRLAIVTSICALPGLHTLLLNHFHDITLEFVNALADGWSSSRRGCPPNQCQEGLHRKRKADETSPPHGSPCHTIDAYYSNSQCSDGLWNRDCCHLKSLRMQDCGFADETTANIFWERASATLSSSLTLLEVMHVQTPLLAYSLSTFLRSCGRQPIPTLQYVNLTSDVVNPNMLSWSILAGGIMECRQSLRSFSLQRVDSAFRPEDMAHEYALGHALGRALLAGAVPHEVAGGGLPPGLLSGILALLLPILGTFPHLKTLRLHDWHLQTPDSTLLSRALSHSFKALKCLDLNDCYWEDPTILYAAITQKRLKRLHIYATEPSPLHIHSLTTYLPSNDSLTQVTVGGLSEALEFPLVLESIAWYVHLNRDYQRRVMIDPSSKVQTCCQVLWRARKDLPALYHLLRETPHLTTLMDTCLVHSL